MLELKGIYENTIQVEVFMFIPYNELILDINFEYFTFNYQLNAKLMVLSFRVILITG